MQHGPKPVNSHAGRQQGFSLVDVVVTALIVSLMAGIGVPRLLRTMAEYRAESAANRIASDLALARKFARSTGSNETVTFDSNNHQYSFSKVANPNIPGTVYSVPLSDSPYNCSVEDISFGGDTFAQFDSYGFPKNGGTVTVRCGRARWLVKLDAASGRVTTGAIVSSGVTP